MNKTLHLLLLFTYFATCTTDMLDFHQDEYDVILDRMEVTRYEKTILRNVKAEFVLYNRTQRVFNASIEILRDLGAQIIIDIQVFKFLSNEYRFFPITVSVNACVEYSRNTFRAKEILDKISNVKPCNLKKGRYEAYNGIPDFSRFPPHLPRGLYKIQAIFKIPTIRIAEWSFYGSIKDKPYNWNN